MKNRGIQKLPCSQYDGSDTKNHLLLNNDSLILNVLWQEVVIVHIQLVVIQQDDVTHSRIPSSFPSCRELDLEVVSPVPPWQYQAVCAKKRHLGSSLLRSWLPSLRHESNIDQARRRGTSRSSQEEKDKLKPGASQEVKNQPQPSQEE
jgi:hypothetical protein